MAECLFGSGVYDGWVLDSGLFPMAVYSFYSSNEDFVFSELSERAGGIGGLNMRMKSVDFKFVDFMFSIFVPKQMDMETLFYMDG